MIKTKPKCILFDFDRTMIFLYHDPDLLLELGHLMRKFYSNYISVEEDPLKDGYFVWHDAHRMVEKKFEITKALELNQEAEHIVTEFERRIVMEKTLFPDIIEIIKKLYSEGICLGIVSSNSSYIIEEKLKIEGIKDCFLGIYGRELPFNPDKLKPSAYPLVSALDKLGFAKEEVWYVGDDIIDVDAAKKAGILAVGMATGNYSTEQLYGRGADLSVSTMTQLYNYIESMEK